MSDCPRPCPLCAGREFYLPQVGDRWICSTCAPPVGRVPATLVWKEMDE